MGILLLSTLLAIVAAILVLLTGGGLLLAFAVYVGTGVAGCLALATLVLVRDLACADTRQGLAPQPGRTN